MSDYENAMTAGPRAALAGQINAFRAGQAEGARPSPLDGDEVARRIAGLTAEQKARAASGAEILAALGQGLAQRPYAERRALLAHMTPALAARGIAPQMLARFDPTTAGLEEVVDQAVRLRRMLA